MKKLLLDYKQNKTMVIAYVQGLNQPLQGLIEGIGHDYFTLANTTTKAVAVIPMHALGCLLEVE